MIQGKWQNPVMPDVDDVITGMSQASQSLMNSAWSQKQAAALAASQAPPPTVGQQGQQGQSLAGSIGMYGQGGSQRGGQGGAPSGAPGRPAWGANASDRDILARTIMAEAGGEGELGMLAAGSVIANRTSENRNLREVIMKPGWFSAWNGVTGYAGGEGALDMSKIEPNQVAYAVTDRILSGQYTDPTGGATHYYNPSVADPVWGARAGGPWKTIGNHVFGKTEY